MHLIKYLIETITCDNAHDFHSSDQEPRELILLAPGLLVCCNMEVWRLIANLSDPYSVLSAKLGELNTEFS